MWSSTMPISILNAISGFNAIGSITISPDPQPPAPAGWWKFARKSRRRGHVASLPSPNLRPALVRTVVEGTPAKAASLDPLGALITPGPDAWFTLMEALATSLRDCLAAKG